MAPTSKQNRYLRALAHHLDPVVIVGEKGVSESVVAATAVALEDHELIKVKIAGADRDEVREAADALVAGTGAHLVQVIGKIVVLYKGREKKPEITLP